jgi:predicted anti-sigma-YlaC factor YlaD
MSQACVMWRGDIGAYIVGALDRETRARVRRHLASCAGCRADYYDLVPVRDWLGRLDPTGEPRARPKQARLPRAPERPIRHRVRRWFLAWAVAAAGGAAAVIIVISAGPVPPAFDSADRATGVHGQARLTATSTGTQIALNVAGLPGGERCTLVAVSAGSLDPAGSWVARYDGSAQVDGTTAISLKQLTALLIESPSHRLLLKILV